MDIYSVVEDRDYNIYFGSSNGLIKYDGHDFTFIKSPDSQLRTSFVGVEKNSIGEIFCINLNGQIFKLVNDSLQLHLEIPDSLLSPVITFCFSNQDNLIIRADEYYEVVDNSFEKICNDGAISEHIDKNSQGAINIIDFSNNTRVEILNSEIKRYENELEFLPKKNHAHHVIKSSQNRMFLCTKRPFKIWKKSANHWEKLQFESEGFIDFFPVSDSIIILTKRQGGLKFIDHYGNVLYSESWLYPEIRFSDVLVDSKGIIWVSTFGQGFVLFPNLELVNLDDQLNLDFSEITSIALKDSSEIFIGCHDGKLYSNNLESHMTEILDLKVRLNHLSYIGFTNSLILGVDEKPGSNDLFKEFFPITRSIKTSTYTQNMFLYGTNEGLFVNSIQDFESKNYNPQTSSERFYDVGRVSSVYYDKKDSSILVGSVGGLKKINGSQISTLEYGDKVIEATGICEFDNKVIIGTKNNGLLFLEEGKLKSLATTTEGLLSNEIITVKKNNDELVVLSNVGIQRFSATNGYSGSISTSNGLISNQFKDIFCFNNFFLLWNENRLIRIPKNRSCWTREKPKIEILSVICNDEFKVDDLQTLEYDENNISIEYQSKNYISNSGLTYQFKLEGLMEHWEKIQWEQNSQSFYNLPDGNYNFKILAMSNNLCSDVSSFRFTIKKPYWKKPLFQLFLFFIFIGISTFVIIRRTKNLKNKWELKRLLKEYEIMAIKAQMNPHFVFNVLNSLQSLFLLGDKRKTLNFLSKFSKLLRHTLNASGEMKISIEEELEIASLYLDLECLRIGKDFTYEINLNLTSDCLKNVYIPALILQPYLENAIRHGLLHKNGEKLISINIFEEGSSLTFEIIDNGIGRRKSSEINKQRDKIHKPFGHKSSQKRVDLYNEIFKKNIFVSIEDLYKNSSPCGTKVRIKLN